MDHIAKYISYIKEQKRYSARTVQIYSDALRRYAEFFEGEPVEKVLGRQCIRAYQIELMDVKGQSPRTVNLHLSVLSGFCRYLVRQGVLKSNPVQMVVRPQQNKRLPVFFKEAAMEKYLQADNALTRGDFLLDLQTEAERKDTYQLCLQRIIVCLLYSTGMRRAELMGLKLGDVDFQRNVLHVRGKGDKMREIPLVSSCVREISLYLQAVEKLLGPRTEDNGTLLLTCGGSPLYASLVDRAVKAELGAMGADFQGRKSPHVLRHSFATGLLENGAELNSIKEVLGHANLAATQVYTHSSPAQLKKVYEAAHPRGGKK